MPVNGSYDIEHIAVDKEREILRLNSQVDLFWEQEYPLYTRLGLRDGIKLLDCGCGPGHLIEKLCSLYPSIDCVGIEIADYLYEAAARNIQTKQLTRCNVFKQSIMKLDFPDNTFDFALIRLVLEHLPDPIAAMTEVKRVLKTGGRAVFIDNDFDFHVQTYPPVPELKNLYAAYCKARTLENGNPRIGRQLPQLLSYCGYSDVSYDVLTANSHLTGDIAFQQSEGSGIALQLIQDGFLTASDYNNLAVNWSAMLKTDGHSIVRLLFAGSGKKSDSLSVHNNNSNANNKFAAGIIGKTDISMTDLSAISKDTLVSELIDTISQIQEIASDKVHPDLLLGDLGLDSVGAVLLKNHIENTLQINIPELDYFYKHSINDTVNMIMDRISPKIKKNTFTKSDCFEEGEI